MRESEGKLFELTLFGRPFNPSAHRHHGAFRLLVFDESQRPPIQFPESFSCLSLFAPSVRGLVAAMRLLSESR